MQYIASVTAEQTINLIRDTFFRYRTGDFQCSNAKPSHHAALTVPHLHFA